MSEEETETEEGKELEEASQQEAKEQPDLDTLASQARKLFYLVLGSMATSLCLAGSLYFVYSSLSTRIIADTSAPLAEMTSLASTVRDDYAKLNFAVEFHNHQMDTLSSRLETVDPTIDIGQFETLRAVMLAQETDFQNFLQTAKIAVRGLSEMVSGPRGWRDEYVQLLDQALQSSEQRESSLSTGGDWQVHKRVETSDSTSTTGPVVADPDPVSEGAPES